MPSDLSMGWKETQSPYVPPRVAISLACFQESCGSSFLSNLVYSTDFRFPSSCQLDSSLNSQETRYEPIWCQMPFYHPRTSMLCNPCQSIHTGSLSHRFSRGYCLGYGSRTCYSLGFESSGFRPLVYRVCGFPSLSQRSQFYPRARPHEAGRPWERMGSGFPNPGSGGEPHPPGRGLRRDPAGHPPSKHPPLLWPRTPPTADPPP